MATKLIIIRHGETKWNRGKVFRGTYDIPLNDNGRNQARLTSEALHAHRIDIAYTSTLARDCETADLVLAPHNIQASPHKGFLDMDYGDWTGKTEEEVKQKWPSEYANWISLPHATRPPGGTTIQEIFDRSFSALINLCEQHEGRNIAIFSHRVVNKLMIIGALGMGLERFSYIIQGNCCLNELEFRHDGFVIQTINNIYHITKTGTEVLTTDF